MKLLFALYRFQNSGFQNVYLQGQGNLWSLETPPPPTIELSNLDR